MHIASLDLITANTRARTHVPTHVDTHANASIILCCCTSVDIDTHCSCMLASWLLNMYLHTRTRTQTHTHTLARLIAARVIESSLWPSSLPSFTIRLSCSYRFTLLFSLLSPSSTVFVPLLGAVSHLSHFLPPPPPPPWLQSPHHWVGFFLSNNLELIFRASLQPSVRGHSVFSLSCFTPRRCTFPSPPPLAVAAPPPLLPSSFTFLPAFFIPVFSLL